MSKYFSNIKDDISNIKDETDDPKVMSKSLQEKNNKIKLFLFLTWVLNTKAFSET